MPKSRKSEPAHPAWDSDVRLLAWLASCVSVFAFLYYYRFAEILLYGDAIAHINIARRVFDSKTPGLLQLGTVWLPLPHLLMIPFLISDEMWRSGAGGSIPSLVAYIFGVIGMFRLTRGAFSSASAQGPARVAAWIAAAIYAANPNLIYMQSTAMGEALYLALFIWSIVYFQETLQGNARALAKCGVCLAAACLTRYDGWFVAVVMVLVVLVMRGRTALQGNSAAVPPTLHASTLVKFILIAAAAPALWLAYNGLVYRNPLEFENGPYSAKAIERKTQSPGNMGHPGSGNVILAARYFVKSAETNVANNDWLQRGWLLLLLASAVLIAVAQDAVRKRVAGLPLVLLLLPLIFYALSIAYGGVPLFVPQFWPFTHYNVRYGLQLLPAFSFGGGFLAYLIVSSNSLKLRMRLAALATGIAFLGISYASIWRATPICLEEAQVNMRTRNQLQTQLAGWLEKLPQQSTLLMYLGDHVGALERAGIPLRRTINEGNHRVWKRPSDPEGLWERALANPSKYADYVVAFEGDPVWQSVRDQHLRELVEIHVSGQPRAILYRAR